MGASPEKTIMLRAGVDCNIFKPGLDNNDIRHKYGLGNDDITLFFVGWLYHFSGLKEVAIELSRTTNKKIKLFIVGDGDAFDELNNIRKTYGLEDRMILVGKQPYAALPGLMSIADIFLLPAYDNEIMHDIVPIKMYEYLAMGKPVIVTKLPGIIAEFGDGNGVIYVDKPEDAVFKALEVLSNGEAAKIGIQARRFVEQNSWDTITNDFEKYLKEVIQANG
jgi:glycosyltransferase involved in cell wall biosynthesis